MTTRIVCEHEDGGVASVWGYCFSEEMFELSEQLFFKERLEKNAQEDTSFFELSEQVLWK